MKNILSCLALLLSFSLYAERIITREKYSIIIPSDTVYQGEEYTLYVDLGNVKNAEVKKNGMLVPIDPQNKARVKLKAAGVRFDAQDNSFQNVHLVIKISNVSIVEDVPYVVKRIPVKKYTMQDSVCLFLEKDSAYRKVQTFYNVFVYDDFIKHLKTHLPLETNIGQLSFAILINSQGEVVRYNCIKNTYAGISTEAIDKAILSYRVQRNMMSQSNFKFGMEVFTFEGYFGNFLYGHGFTLK